MYNRETSGSYVPKWWFEILGFSSELEQNMTEDKSIINAAPTKELFISMLIRDVTLRDAIGDLLDNCIDGALRLRPDGNYKGLKVEIELDTAKGHFTINDNCGG